MKISEMFSGSYLKAADLQGRRVSATIDRVEMETLGSGSDAEQKPIVYFQNKEKGLVLNKTNGNMIAEIAGTEETDEWNGVKIALYPAKVDFQGKRVDAIRIDYPAGQPKPQPSAADDDCPF